MITKTKATELPSEQVVLTVCNTIEVYERILLSYCEIYRHIYTCIMLEALIIADNVIFTHCRAAYIISLKGNEIPKKSSLYDKMCGRI